MPRPSIQAAILTWLLAALAPSSARAGVPAPAASAASDATAATSAAEELYKTAQERFLAKDYAAALPMFEQVLQQSGSPNARLYVARCHKELGHLAEAYAEMERTVRDATRMAASEPKYEGTRNAAAVALALMDPIVGKLVLAIADNPPGLQVEIDGHAIGAERLERPIAVETGKIVVTASAPGRQSAKAELEIGAGQSRTVTLTLAPAATPGVPRPPPLAAEPHGGEVRTAGFVIGGLGVASMVVVAVTGGLALGSYGRLDDDCGGERCTDLAYADEVDRGKALRLTTNVFLGVGAACLAAGGLMVIFGGPSEEPTAAAIELAPLGAGMALRGRF
jgi:hypothetical protein